MMMMMMMTWNTALKPRCCRTAHSKRARFILS
jgi:hypothetical protein